MSAQRNATGRSTDLGPLAFALALLILGGVGYFMSDYYGVQQGVIGLLAWLTILVLVFLGRVAYYALALLPDDVENRHEEGFALILQHYFGGPARQRRDSQWEGVPPSLLSLRAGVVDSHIALALGQGGRFSRAVGSGYVKLNEGEYIEHVIDLRDHMRQQEIKGVTRDGIPFETTMAVTFCVRRLGEEDAPDDDPYPYDPTAVFQVSYFSSYGEGESEISWMERIVPLAAALLVAELSNYTLDEVYTLSEPDHAGTQRLEPERVAYIVREQLQAQLEPHGIQIIAIEIGNLILPEDVRAQRIANWQTEWQKEVNVQLAKGNATAWQQVELARAEAEIDLINQILDGIEEIGWSEQISLSDVVTLVTIEALENAAVDDPALLPSQMMQTLTQLQMLTASHARLEAGRDGEESST